MDAINLEAVIDSRFPGFLDRMPPLISSWALAMLKRILLLEEINRGLVFLKDKKKGRGQTRKNDLRRPGTLSRKGSWTS